MAHIAVEIWQRCLILILPRRRKADFRPSRPHQAPLEGIVMAKCSSHLTGRLTRGGASAKRTESNHPVKRLILNPPASNCEKLSPASRFNRCRNMRSTIIFSTNRPQIKTVSCHKRRRYPCTQRVSRPLIMGRKQPSLRKTNHRKLPLFSKEHFHLSASGPDSSALLDRIQAKNETSEVKTPP